MTLRPILLTLLLTATLAAQTSPTPPPPHPHPRPKTLGRSHPQIRNRPPRRRRHTRRRVYRLATSPSPPTSTSPSARSFYTDFNESNTSYHAEIRWLYMLGAATYQVETGKTDPEGTNLYALHSVLKGYAAILRQKPDAHDKKLDEYAKLDAKR